MKEENKEGLLDLSEYQKDKDLGMVKEEGKFHYFPIQFIHDSETMA